MQGMMTCGSSALQTALEAVVEQYNKFFPEVLDELERRCVKEAFSTWAGYAAFCEEHMGVKAEKIASVVLEPVMGQIKDVELRAERLGVEPDAGLVEQISEGLVEAWRVAVGGSV